MPKIGIFLGVTLGFSRCFFSFQISVQNLGGNQEYSFSQGAQFNTVICLTVGCFGVGLSHS